MTSPIEPLWLFPRAFVAFILSLEGLYLGVFFAVVTLKIVGLYNQGGSFSCSGSYCVVDAVFLAQVFLFWLHFLAASGILIRTWPFGWPFGRTRWYLGSLLMILVIHVYWLLWVAQPEAIGVPANTRGEGWWGSDRDYDPSQVILGLVVFVSFIEFLRGILLLSAWEARR